MNAKLLIAVASFAAIAAGAARAESPDAGGQYAAKIDGSRTRAEVQAEAAIIPATRSTEPAGSRVAAPLKSSVNPATLRAQAAEAVRTGQISYGEAGRI
jgi:hypothetical protein